MGTDSQNTTCRSFGARLLGELKRLVVLGLLGGALFIAGKYYCVDRLNEEIRTRIEEQLRQHYAGMNVSIRSARRVPGQGVELRGVVIGPPGQPPLVHIEELLAECDTRLPDFVTKRPAITRLHLQRVKLRAEREETGQWNAFRLLPLPGCGGSAPQATISDGSLEVVDPNQKDSAPLILRNIELTIRPKEAGPQIADGNSSIVLQVQGSMAGDHVERIDLEGWVNPHLATWEVRGAVKGLEFSPRLRSALPAELGDALLPLSSVRGRTQFAFSVKQPAGSSVKTANAQPLEFCVQGTIADGRVDDARLPEPLSDVEAKIRIDNQGVTIEQLSARCGATSLKLNARLQGYTAESPFSIGLEATGFELSRLPLESFPASVADVYQRFSPRGVVDVTANIAFDGLNWQRDILLQCRDLSVQYDRFPYRLTGGIGTLELKHEKLNARMRFFGGGQIVQCRAEVQNPGPDFTGWVEVQSEGSLALDERLIGALAPKHQKIVRQFRPRGNISFQGRLQRNPSDKFLHRRLDIALHDCSIQHERFPYPIDKVNGSLQLTNGDWLFRNLTGRNDSATITCEGAWLEAPPDGHPLALTFTATDVPLAEELRRALNPQVQRIWSNLRPRGNIDHLVVVMKYDPKTGRPSIEVKADKWPPGKNGEGRAISIQPIWFPYQFVDLTGSIHYLDGAMQLTNLQATHGRTNWQAEGFCGARPDGSCRLQLNRLSADRLQFDQDLIAALPQCLAEGISRLNPQGQVNGRGGLGVTIPAHPDARPEIDWDLEFTMADGRLATSTPIEHLHGGIRLAGTSSGNEMASRGELTIDSAIVRNVQLTRITGPLLIEPQRILFGAAAESDVKGRVPREITASVFGGSLAVNGEMLLRSDAPFALQASLDNGDLSQAARELAPRQRGVSGKVFGSVNMSGSAHGMHTWRGNGHLRLRDGDIYELPVMIAMLKLLSVQRPDRTAFNNGNIDFRIEGDDLVFQRIDFNGDAICLKGKGRMNAQQQIDLKFYPQMGRDEFHLPFLRPLVGEASRQFMLVEVTGTLNRPDVNRTVFPELDESLKQLFPELADEPPAKPASLLSAPRAALEKAGIMPR